MRLGRRRLEPRWDSQDGGDLKRQHRGTATNIGVAVTCLPMEPKGSPWPVCPSCAHQRAANEPGRPGLWAKHPV